MSKVFDSISICLLLGRIRDLGVPDKLLKLLTSYLTGRKYIVQYGEYSSKPYVPTSGVPQGSQPGKLTVITYINEIAILQSLHIEKFFS